MAKIDAVKIAMEDDRADFERSPPLHQRASAMVTAMKANVYTV